MKLTPVHFITLAALHLLALSASPAYSAAKSSSAPFDATFLAYQQLSADPRGTREQWLRVVRSFVEIHRAAEMSQTGRRSLFFAGRSCLGLYKRSGNKADLEEAIRYLNKFVRMNRKGPYLILGLQELKEAHLLKRRLAAIREAHPRGPSFGAKTRTEASLNPVNVRLAARLPGEPAAPQHNTLAGQYAADVPRQSAPVASRSHREGTSASSGYNCTGNPFFGPQGAPRIKPTPPVLSASLPPPTMNDAPRPLRLEPVETAPPIDPAPVSPITEPPATEPAQREKAPHGDAVQETSPQDSPAPSSTESSDKYVVVIDPGHGGKDPGATSNDGQLKEKEVTLRIANRIKVRLERKLPRVTVALTRTDDAFLPLQERTALANSLNADLFVSIHCNAAEDASSRGIETYYLSKASSKIAMAAAARENGIPAEHMSDIDATLLDLLIDSKKSESVKLAESVHNALISTIAETTSVGRNRGVKRAPFYVLLGAKMPAILVECGFINGKERESLKESSFLDSLAEGVTDGITLYLQGMGDKG